MVALPLVALPVSSAPAQVTFGGQIRPRYEFRDPVGIGNDAFTSMRVRVNLAAALEKNVRAFIQLQDVRVFGEESNTLTDFQADNLDLHQGYIEVSREGSVTLSARAGRQELLFGGERLIGPVGWTQQGRSFDGLRLGAATGWGKIDLIAMQLADAGQAAHDHDAELLGGYALLNEAGPGSLEVYGLLDHVAGDTLTDPETNQTTVGARWLGQTGVVSYRAEGSYQMGTRAGVDLSAFMFGARLGATFADGKAGLTAWYDYLSGDDDLSDNKVKSFSTLYATNHKFYGFADFFLNIPVHTGGGGLQDVAVKAFVAPITDVRVAVDAHKFSLVEQGTRSSKDLGNEIDVTAMYRYSANLRVTAGWSYIFKGQALEDLGRLTEDMKFAYLMLTASY